MKKVILPLLAGFLLSGCHANSGAGSSADAPVREKYPNPNPADARECARNFTYDGSFARGRTFKTQVFVKNVSQTQAVKRAVRFISSEGLHVTNVDTDLGLIRAYQSVSYGSHKTTPLNVGIGQEKGGVKVNLTYSISGGLTTPVEGVQKFFCSAVQAIEGS